MGVEDLLAGGVVLGEVRLLAPPHEHVPARELLDVALEVRGDLGRVVVLVDERRGHVRGVERDADPAGVLVDGGRAGAVIERRDGAVWLDDRVVLERRRRPGSRS